MPSKSNYICVKCEKEMMVVKVGVMIEEHTDDGGNYKIWGADLLECSECKTQIISNFADRPLAHHFDPNYFQLQKKERFHIR